MADEGNEERERQLLVLRARFREARRITVIPPVVVRMKRGGLHWRWQHLPGAETTSHPVDHVNSRQLKTFLSNLEKIRRAARLHLKATAAAAAANRRRGHKTTVAVIAAAASPAFTRLGAGAASAIARKLGISASQVRRILAKSRAGKRA